MASPYAAGTLLDTAWSSGHRQGLAVRQKDASRAEAEARWFRSWLALQDPMGPRHRLRDAYSAGYTAGNPAPAVEYFL